MAGIKMDSSDYLFRNITKTKQGEKIRKSGKMSYTRVREIVKEKFQEIGLDVQKYGLHSLRARGATVAANAGVPDREFKRHGRWKSETAKDGYVKDSVDKRLLVSKSLGI